MPGSRARLCRVTSTSGAERPWLASYPPDVPADFDFPSVLLTRLLDDAAESFPGNVAVTADDTALTYAELREQIDRLAGGLAGLGIAPGDRVAVLLPNCVQHVVAFFAVLRIGAIVVHGNPVAAPDELRAQLVDSAPAAVICLDRAADTVLGLRDAAGYRCVIVTSLLDYRPAREKLRLRLPTPAARAARRRLVAEVPRDADVYRMTALMRGSAPVPQAPGDGSDVAVLQYTGGTTGESKAAMLTHANLVANAHQTRLWLPDATSGAETTLTVLPLFHVYGLTMCLLTTVLLAGRLVLVPRFDVDLVLDTIERERPTLFPGVPPIYHALSDALRAQRRDLSSLRTCISGAMRLPPEVQRRFEQFSGARLVEGYGTTESSPATHCNPVDGPRRPGSIGIPLPGTLARVVDADDPTRVLPPGETGELVVKGPQVFGGYWGRAADEQVLLEDGWLLTGDLAVMEADGWFRIVDRKKDLIIAGGFNIYPTEVEEVLAGLPGVAASCVIGLPDRYRGETVKVFVVAERGAALTEDAVREHCAASLSAYKVPKLVEFRDELPRSAVGKALRRILLAEELARQESSAPAGSGRPR
jgi:long-chain acyl-CoA synthetase